MKDIEWLGRSHKDLCSFPDDVKQEAGYQLHLVQMGDEPMDWKPMTSIGSGVKEIRINEAGAYRVIYVARLENNVYVLHSFQKKTQKTPKKDIDHAKSIYKELLRGI